MSIAEKFETIADAVYQKGYEDGAGNNTGGSYDEGYTDGYKKGRDDEYDAFWDAYQNSGKKTSYAYAFYAARWDNTIYNPKYDIIPSNANSMFLQSGVEDTLKPINISDLSSNTAGMFQYSKIRTIQKLIVSEQNTFANGFTSCTALKNITFEGTIGRSISFADSPLTIESLKNLISHLKDYSVDEPSTHYTLTLSTASKTALATEGATAEYNGEPCTWAELVSFKKWDLM